MVTVVLSWKLRKADQGNRGCEKVHAANVETKGGRGERSVGAVAIKAREVRKQRPAMSASREGA